ncbi:beta-galactosidase [Microbacterium sp. ET2]|uniref:glycoside hydrolase family 35 protein n=1 Tax=Microbacterium albipurpureum TaxID=3050384 RepID=UPI00259CA6D1|nr:beta-galactosidase family protein [Microbacterium sp. ET2 (Ac-2212)]WJL96971.1 beta-galactosidase [Microbacterium sp. ET2 (Ac-2212)]
MTTFTIGESDFLLDGSPHRIIAGALHYFRVHTDHWADRIRKARLLGLNTIETYVAWNAHEPVRGAWDTTGPNDLGRFLDLIAAEGMHAIVRPGPYICAEWHNGGLPVWLTAMPGIRLRSSEPGYLAEVSRYLERVYDIVVPRQIDRGGNVILVQIENEYGAYGADKAYLQALTDLTRDAGITVPLTTVDQPMPDMLRDGSLPGLHVTGSFGSRAAERLATLREYQPTGPLMCSEFWNGWFDWWGGIHHTTDAETSAAELDTLLAAGASVNLYMFHGGTNFGVTNGANDKGSYSPIVTSYDYDAPLDEAGNPTPKYRAFREVIARYASVPEEYPAETKPSPELRVELEGTGDWLPKPRSNGDLHAEPPVFEDLDVEAVLVRYDCEIPERAYGGEVAAALVVGEIRDRAWLEVDGTRVAQLSRADGDRAAALPWGRALTVLVENEGRINYGASIGETKGIAGGVVISGEPLAGWQAQPIDLQGLAETIARAPVGPTTGRAGLRGSFALEAPTDLHLDTVTLGSGFAVLNGFVLGRYVRRKPQRTLFVPAPLTRAGMNELVLIELDQIIAPSVSFVANADLGPTEE